MQMLKVTKDHKKKSKTKRDPKLEDLKLQLVLKELLKQAQLLQNLFIM